MAAVTAVVLTQVRRWSAARLAVAVVRLDDAVRLLVEVDGALARARPPGSWRGTAADAARAEHERMARQVHRLAAGAAAVRSGLAAAADAVAGLHAGLAAAQELADGNGFTIAADGVVADAVADAPAVPAVAAAGPAAGAGARSAVRAEIVDRVEQVLRAAGALDTELAALLHTIAADTAGPDPSPPVVPAAAIGVPAPPGGSVADSVADSAGWWSVLSAAARQRVVAEHPEWIGNRDGIPAVARNEANRRLLGERAAGLDADLGALQARYDALTAAGPGPMESAWLAARDDLLARLAELRRRQEVADAVGAAAAGADRRLLLLDLDRDRPRAAVATGDVDTADHVAVLTPGFGNTVGGDLPGVVETAGALRDRSAAVLDGSGRSGESVAAVAWLGYDVPGGPLNVSTADAARRGRRRPGPLLRRDRRGAPHRPAPDRARPLLRLADHRLRAAAGPWCRRRGAVRLARDRHRRPRRRARARRAHRRRRGAVGPGSRPRLVRRRPEPARRRHGAVGPRRDPAGRRAAAGSVLHSQYLTPGTTSQYNVAATVAGLPDQRILDPGVGMGDVLRDALGRRSGS